MTSPASTVVFQGRTACIAQLRQLLLGLDPAAAGSAELLLCDHGFAAWPLDEPAVQLILAQWLRPAGRRLRLVAVDFERVAQNHPRFARWRRDWTHRIEPLSPIDGLIPPGLRLLLQGPAAAQWLEAPDHRLRLITNPVHLAALQAETADFLQRCEPAWPATTSGL